MNLNPVISWRTLGIRIHLNVVAFVLSAHVLTAARGVSTGLVLTASVLMLRQMTNSVMYGGLILPLCFVGDVV